MTRVHKVRASSVPSGIARHRQEHRENPSYQVKMETITQKKTLKTYLTYSVRPPRGYTFIPAGDPQLTKKCKKCSKDLDMPLYIVSAGASKTAELSKEIHRIGYHFSTAAVDQACQSLGVTLNSSGRVNNTNFNYLKENLNDQNLHIKKARSRLPAEAKQIDGSMSQKLIDFLATEAIRDLFPKIPPKDMEQVIDRAFDKRAGLVGTAEGFSLARRANLAVGAHIRHTYTNYDQLLKDGGFTWQAARHGVEQFTLDKLVSWRGEEDDNPIIEEVLREVVVIPDDTEDSSISRIDVRTVPHQEMVSAEDIDATAIDLTISDEDDLEDDNEFYKAKPQRSSNSTSLLPAARGEREARDNEHRHAMWNQALRRYKQKPIVASTGFTTNHESTKSSDPRVTKAPSNPSTSAPGLANYNRSSAQPHKDGRAVSRPQDPHDIPLKQDKDLHRPGWQGSTQISSVAMTNPFTASVDLPSPSKYSRNRAAGDFVYQSAELYDSPMNNLQISSNRYPRGVQPSVEHPDADRVVAFDTHRGPLEPGQGLYNQRSSALQSEDPQQREIVYVRSQDQQSNYLPGTRPGTILIPLNEDPRRIATVPSDARDPLAARYELNTTTQTDSPFREHWQQATPQQQSKKPIDLHYSQGTAPSLGHDRVLVPVENVHRHRFRDQSNLADRTSPSAKKPRLVRLSDNETTKEHTQPQVIPVTRHTRSKAHNSSLDLRHDQPIQTHQQAYFPSSKIHYLSGVTSHDSTKTFTQYPAQSRSYNPGNSDDSAIASQPQPHPRLIRLGPTENLDPNLPAHVQRFQQPSSPANAMSPRQIALGDAVSFGQSNPDKPKPRQILATHPEQMIRYISRQ